MYWSDEGYLLGKNNFDENSIIADFFTLEHGKCTGIVYGGSSRKQKKILQVGNKILLNWKAKSVNKIGYFTTELIDPISPIYFDDKKRSACILSASSILKILLPLNQTNKDIYSSFEKMLNDLYLSDWINLYIYWEISLIKQLGFETHFTNNNIFNSNKEISEALNFNKKLFMDNFIIPNKLKLPFFRNILEKYFI